MRDVASDHRRTRNDHRTETAEDVCEAILTLREAGEEPRNGLIAKRLGVSAVTVTKTLERLRRDGWVEGEPYRPIRLTERGEALAVAARERHEVVLAFLRWLGVDDDTAQADAEGIEHHVSAATLERMRVLAAG